MTRRDFLRVVGGATVVAAAGIPVFATARSAAAAPAKAGSQDSLVAQLYGTFTPEQKSAVCFGWESDKRLMVANNWHIVPQTIGEFYTPEQQAKRKKLAKRPCTPTPWMRTPSPCAGTSPGPWRKLPRRGTMNRSG